jgi:hypothetical protein
MISEIWSPVPSWLPGQSNNEYSFILTTNFFKTFDGKKGIFRLCRTPEFATNGKALIYGGDSAYPPEPPLRFAIVSYYLPGNYRFRVVPQRQGAKALYAVAPKEREEK